MTTLSPSSLTALGPLADELLETARSASSGRAPHGIRGVTHAHDGGRESHGALTHVVLALIAGARLSEHRNPGEATLQVLRGRTRLSAGEQSIEVEAGEMLVIPQSPHDLEALEDSVVILTISRGAGSEA